MPRERIATFLAVVFAVFILTLILLADRGTLPPLMRAAHDFPGGDKAGHVILFGLLNFFVTRAIAPPPPSRTSKRAALTAGLILALAVAAEEFSQRYFASRTFDLVDLLASYLGLFLGGWLAMRTKIFP
jgi:VanZ family protein